MKCPACKAKECKGKYKNRELCESIDCKCICAFSKQKRTAQRVFWVGQGALLITGGVFLTVSTNVLGVAAGGALIGAGTSIIAYKIQKALRKEKICRVEIAREASIGACIGAITGPIGKGVSHVAKGLRGAAPFVVKGAGGYVTGTISGGISGITAKNATKKSVGVSMLTGGIVGIIDGTGSQAAALASKNVKNTAGKVVTKVVIERATAVPTNLGSELIKKGEINPEKTIGKTIGKSVAGVMKGVIK